MDIYEMLKQAGLSSDHLSRGQHWCAAMIHNAGIASYNAACEAYLKATGQETNWH